MLQYFDQTIADDNFVYPFTLGKDPAPRFTVHRFAPEPPFDSRKRGVGVVQMVIGIDELLHWNVAKFLQPLFFWVVMRDVKEPEQFPI